MFSFMIRIVVRIWMRVTRVMSITSMVLWMRLLVTCLMGVQPIMGFNYLRQLVLYNIVVLSNY